MLELRNQLRIKLLIQNENGADCKSAYAGSIPTPASTCCLSGSRALAPRDLFRQAADFSASPSQPIMLAARSRRADGLAPRTPTLRMRISSRTILVLLLLGLLTPAGGAAERGWCGVNVKFETRGFLLARELDSVEIVAVARGSPAELGGLRAGDRILRIDGCEIPGCSEFQAGKALRRSIGETLRVRGRRSNGVEYETTLVAGRRPE